MGYLNNIEKQGNKYIRKPKMEFSNWDNEKKVMELLGFDVVLKEDGTLEREWIEGELISSLDNNQKQSLVDAIERVHSLPIENISKHDWYKYQQHLDKLTESQQELFKKLAAKYQDKDLAVSHNDINFHNMLWDGKQIILIDYEWANLNHPYFDYVQFFITEGIQLRDDLNWFVWNDILKLSLLYFIMWTYEAPQVEEVFSWRENYRILLGV